MLKFILLTCQFWCSKKLRKIFFGPMWIEKWDNVNLHHKLKPSEVSLDEKNEMFKRAQLYKLYLQLRKVFISTWICSKNTKQKNPWCNLRKEAATSLNHINSWKSFVTNKLIKDNVRDKMDKRNYSGPCLLLCPKKKSRLYSST